MCSLQHQHLCLPTALPTTHTHTHTQEWLVDLFAAAEREGEAGVFADAYEASELHAVGWEALARSCRLAGAVGA